MTPREHAEPIISAADQELVLASLEPEQLATSTRHHLPRRKLTGAQTGILWALRLYLLFMTAVVIYQIWSGRQ